MCHKLYSSTVVQNVRFWHCSFIDITPLIWFGIHPTPPTVVTVDRGVPQKPQLLTATLTTVRLLTPLTRAGVSTITLGSGLTAT